MIYEYCKCQQLEPPWQGMESSQNTYCMKEGKRMYQIDFKHPDAKLYFCGIGGSSMSGLAGMMKRFGFTVWGSDQVESPHSWQAEKEGITVIIGQNKENITDDIDCVIFTAAISKENPEYAVVEEKGIPHITRAELLGQIMAQYPMSIAISGTHGKTTTTSFISEILLRDGQDPSLQIGGVLNSMRTSYRIGETDRFVAEACEYTNSFLSLNPKIGIITNIEADHLDFFKDLDDIRHSFRRFAENIPADGWLIIDTEIPHVEEITDGLACHVIYFGDDYEKADYYAENIRFNDAAHPSFTCVRKGKDSQEIELQLPGKQYVWDALAAIAACDLCGASEQSIHDALQAFKGTDRRFQLKGIRNGIKIVDDYAHHPTEVELTLDAAQHMPHHMIYACYQPHTYSRTKALMDDIAKALHHADGVVLPPICAARETDTLGITSQDLADKVEALGTPCHVFPDFKTLEDWVLNNLEEDDIIITMGPGDVYQIADDLAQYHYDFPEDE